MRPSARSEPVAEPKEFHLVNRCQDHVHNRLLDNLVLQSGDPERSCPAVRLGYLNPPNRQRPVRSSTMQARVKVEQPLFQPCAVRAPRFAIDARCGVLLKSEVGRPKRLRRDVVEERGKTFLRIPLCSFPYPDCRLWHAPPTLCSARALATRFPLG